MTDPLFRNIQDCNNPSVPEDREEDPLAGYRALAGPEFLFRFFGCNRIDLLDFGDGVMRHPGKFTKLVPGVLTLR